MLGGSIDPSVYLTAFAPSPIIIKFGVCFLNAIIDNFSRFVVQLRLHIKPIASLHRKITNYTVKLMFNAQIFAHAIVLFSLKSYLWPKIFVMINLCVPF